MAARLGNMPGRVWTIRATDFTETVSVLLTEVGFKQGFEESGRSTILLKPNLVESLQPPITTPVKLVEEIVLYLQKNLPDARLVIGEGTGSIDYTTFTCFDELGYSEMAAKYGVELIDLNLEPSVQKKNSSFSRWPQMYLPELLDEVFLFSVPVLKAHSLAGVTLTMKNMMGCPPPAHYQQGGHWGKSSFHDRMQDSIFDLNRYRTPDFTLLDATVGMALAHLWGPTCDPPVGRLASGYDPVAIDSYGCELLGRDYKEIGHIRDAHELLGLAEPLDIVEL